MVRCRSDCLIVHCASRTSGTGGSILSNYVMSDYNFTPSHMREDRLAPSQCISLSGNNDIACRGRRDMGTCQHQSRKKAKYTIQFPTNLPVPN